MKSLAEIASHIAFDFNQKLNNLQKLYPIYEELLEAGIPMKEMDHWNFNWLTTEIKDLKDFNKIHKIIGPLTQYNLEPVKDNNGVPTGEVWVSMHAKTGPTQYNFYFKYKKVLPVEAKCRVVTKMVTVHEVVCNV